MKRLPAAKRNQLIMVIAATTILVGVIFVMLIVPQKESNKKLATTIRERQTTLDTYRRNIKEADLIATTLTDVTLQLNRAEEDVANGDVNAWCYETLRRFKAGYHVDIPSIAQPTITEVDLLSGFPYRQAKVNLTGTAYFHDLGKFVADFENTFPHMRMLNLVIDPASLSPGSERVSFRLEVVALVKPNT